MINAKRLSKLDIVISFVKNFRSIIPILIIGGIQIKDAEGMKLLLFILLGSLFVLSNGIGSFLAWRKFQYSLEQDRLIIRKGIFNREEKTIYYNRIHSVNVQQPLLLRLFGTASLQIETPGGKPGTPEGELRVLKHEIALSLQRQLRHLRSISAGAATGAATGTATETAIESATGVTISAGSVTNMPSTQADETSGHVAGVASSSSGNTILDDAQVSSASSSDGKTNAVEEQWYTEHVEQNEYDYKYHISFLQLLKAALTSFNINFALIFIFGIYSFADDVLEIVFPGMYDRVLNDVINQYSALPIFLLLMLTVLVAGFVWLLSIIIYLIKFGDYQISRSQEQLAVSYGLLEKKSFIFDQSKVQAVIMNENLLRQWLGFAELRVQVITSNTMEQLVIHPFARKKDIVDILAQLLPDRSIQLRSELHAPPSSAFRTYAMVPSFIVLLATLAAVWWWKWAGLWLLVLLPISWLWSYFCMKSAGVWLEGKDLILRNRGIGLTTYFVSRKNMVTLSLKTSPIQRKRKFSSIQVQVLGSAFPYKVKSIDNEHLYPIWTWFSRK